MTSNLTFSTLASVIEKLPHLSTINLQELDLKWRRQALDTGVNEKIDTKSYWGIILNSKNIVGAYIYLRKFQKILLL